jgi:hypothetical protein
MTKIILSAGTFFIALFFPYLIAAQTADSAQTKTSSIVFQVTVNGKAMPFNQGKILAFTVIEDGSVSILAQSTTDILNANVLVLNITPADTSKRITRGEYKILPEEAVSDYMVRAEYSSNADGNSSYWWSDASHVKGGFIIIDEITNSTIKGRFSFTGVMEKEDGSMDSKNLVKITKGVFDLPLENKSRLDPR